MKLLRKRTTLSNKSLSGGFEDAVFNPWIKELKSIVVQEGQ
ncbi:MAG: hypothetical protein QXP16_01365 [Candidatus Bathyarchaeia archaeon]